MICNKCNCPHDKPDPDKALPDESIVLIYKKWKQQRHQTPGASADASVGGKLRAFVRVCGDRGIQRAIRHIDQCIENIPREVGNHAYNHTHGIRCVRDRQECQRAGDDQPKGADANPRFILAFCADAPAVHNPAHNRVVDRIPYFQENDDDCPGCLG